MLASLEADALRREGGRVPDSGTTSTGEVALEGDGEEEEQEAGGWRRWRELAEVGLLMTCPSAPADSTDALGLDEVE